MCACSKSSVLQPVRLGSKVSDVIAMEIEVKGLTESYQVLLEPYAVVIPGEIFICTTTRKHFKVLKVILFDFYIYSLFTLVITGIVFVLFLSDVEPQQDLHLLSVGEDEQ